MHAVSLGHFGFAPLWLGLEPGRKIAPFPSACFRGTTDSMAKQTVQPKKRRGPAPTGKGTPIQVRLQPSHLKGLDAWIAKQNVPLTRPEAIRAMMETALNIPSKDSGKKPAKKAKGK
jgi:hypothetical protein